MIRCANLIGTARRVKHDDISALLRDTTAFSQIASASWRQYRYDHLSFRRCAVLRIGGTRNIDQTSPSLDRSAS
jgi:hypothetical protein